MPATKKRKTTRKKKTANPLKGKAMAKMGFSKEQESWIRINKMSRKSHDPTRKGGKRK